MLFLVSTPIGNLEDLSGRARRILQSVDTVLAEDTRVTRKLLNHIEARPKIERFDEHTAFAKTSEIVERVLAGEDIALVSDAGTPGISDPGQALVDAVLQAETRDELSAASDSDAASNKSHLPTAKLVTVIPGPSAVVAALTASGLPSDTFYFGGFLPRKQKARCDLLERLSELDATLVFYESPKRLLKTLEAISEVFSTRHCAVVRELTKMHEEVVRGTPVQLLEQFSARDSIKGEIVLIIAPEPKERIKRVHIDKYGR